MFNENSRVKIPAILHLCRLGYEYLSLSSASWDEQTNVFTDIFQNSLQKINPDIQVDDIKRYYSDILIMLENEDLGKEFYAKLTSKSGIKLIVLITLSKILSV